MAVAPTRTAFENLARAFEGNPVFGHLRAYDLYRDWLEAAWAFLDAADNPEGFRLCLDRHTRAQGEEFGRLLGLYADAVEADPFRDILGDVFMRLDVKSVAAGQYFTPSSVAGLMARMHFPARSGSLNLGLSYVARRLVRDSVYPSS